MTDDQREPSPQESASAGANAGWTALSLLVSGMLVWGGVGWLVDWWLGTRFATPIGVVIGAAGGIYLVFRRASSFAEQTNPPQHDDPPGQGPQT